MRSNTTDEMSLFRKERWPHLVVGALFFFLAAWFMIPPLLVGFASVWPFRGRVAVFLHARRRWERELAIGFSGFVVGVIIFMPPYIYLIDRYVLTRW